MADFDLKHLREALAQEGALKFLARQIKTAMPKPRCLPILTQTKTATSSIGNPLNFPESTVR
ncbi:MAG: hypothetical protein LBS96_03875 [Oscillospiraceae bacterium]|nr:hypothetical protein [Oscillospiraceae bacterium]